MSIEHAHGHNGATAGAHQHGEKKSGSNEKSVAQEWNSALTDVSWLGQPQSPEQSRGRIMNLIRFLISLLDKPVGENGKSVGSGNASAKTDHPEHKNHSGHKSHSTERMTDPDKAHAYFMSNVLATGPYAEKWDLDNDTAAVDWNGAYGLEGENPWDGSTDDVDGFIKHLEMEKVAFVDAMERLGLAEMPSYYKDRDARMKEIVNTIGNTISENGIEDTDAMRNALIGLGASEESVSDPQFVSQFSRLVRAMSDNHNMNVNHIAHDDRLITDELHQFSHLFNKNRKERAGGEKELYHSAAGDGIGGGGAKPQYVADALSFEESYTHHSEH